ncbi:uncharacterized protein LOC126902755 [Daktulosphaira vitifoliae]|uniref:uncharacterized protein LOC126902755 n=1 Tax=Daktulosphaira vitifoliae TaxID=58002 RepID=UPI0021AA7591|nr:uncharacterized protein LOC126902755 [Daktulosphaira vitifoliae]
MKSKILLIVIIISFEIITIAFSVPTNRNSNQNSPRLTLSNSSRFLMAMLESCCLGRRSTTIDNPIISTLKYKLNCEKLHCDDDNESALSDDECAVCMDETMRRNMYLVPCGHLYCIHCSKFLYKDKKCFMCSAPFTDIRTLTEEESIQRKNNDMGYIITPEARQKQEKSRAQ